MERCQCLVRDRDGGWLRLKLKPGLEMGVIKGTVVIILDKNVMFSISSNYDYLQRDVSLHRLLTLRPGPLATVMTIGQSSVTSRNLWLQLLSPEVHSLSWLWFKPCRLEDIVIIVEIDLAHSEIVIIKIDLICHRRHLNIVLVILGTKIL